MLMFICKKEHFSKSQIFDISLGKKSNAEQIYFNKDNLYTYTILIMPQFLLTGVVAGPSVVLWGGSGRVWAALDGSGRLWTGLGGSGWVWTDLDGSGRVWTGLDGSGRVWKGLDGSGRVRTGLGGSGRPGRVWKSLELSILVSGPRLI